MTDAATKKRLSTVTRASQVSLELGKGVILTLARCTGSLVKETTTWRCNPMTLVGSLTRTTLKHLGT